MVGGRIDKGLKAKEKLEKDISKMLSEFCSKHRCNIFHINYRATYECDKNFFNEPIEQYHLDIQVHWG